VTNSYHNIKNSVPSSAPHSQHITYALD